MVRAEMYHCIVAGLRIKEPFLSISHRPGRGSATARIAPVSLGDTGRGLRPAPGRATGVPDLRAGPGHLPATRLDSGSLKVANPSGRRFLLFLLFCECFCLSLTLTASKTNLIRTLSEHVVRRMASPIVVDSTPDQQAATVELEARGREKCVDSGDVSNGHVCSKHRW